MIKFIHLALVAVTVSVTTSLPSHEPEDSSSRDHIRRQTDSPFNVPDSEDRAQAVIDVFRLSWEGYYRYAFPNDELKPVTNGFSNSRNGWGASAVDALSTALIMGQRDIVNQILEHIPTINWSQTATEVSLFETTIRYLGGMLSGYDLLKGPLAHLADDPANVDALLTQSIHLANNLSYAFETPSGIPWNVLNFSTRGHDGNTNGLATVGTLILEWTRLSDLTGNRTYADLVNKAQQYLLNPQPQPLAEPFPGLLGMSINVTTGEFLDATGGWIGGADSFYEYLIKMYMYNPSVYGVLRDRWITAADSTMQYLASHPAFYPNITFLAAYSGTSVRPISQHLACFAGGTFILAGQLLAQAKYTEFGLALTHGCHETYINTPTGIGPEQFTWETDTAAAAAIAAAAGPNPPFNAPAPPPPFNATDPSYSLRPELLESYFYAHRATRNPLYRDYAWTAFRAIVATTAAHSGSGFSSVADVYAAPGGGRKTDFQESFWFAETCKYAFLSQWEGGACLGGAGWGERDGWVFNTEAHPVRVVGG